MKDNAKWHEAEEKARQAREEKARREREQREREAKQRALVDVSVEDEQQGVMDNLLEALKSGSAFNVSRHTAGTPAHKRTPRSAGRLSAKHNSTPSATEQDLTSPTPNSGGNSTNTAIRLSKASDSAKLQNSSKPAFAANEASAASGDGTSATSTDTVIRLNRKSEASTLSPARPPSEGSVASSSIPAAATASQVPSNAKPQSSSAEANGNQQSRERASSGVAKKHQDAAYLSLSKAHHPAALKGAQLKQQGATAKSHMPLQPQLSLPKDQQQTCVSAMTSGSPAATPRAIPSQIRPQSGTHSPRGGVVNTNLSSKVYSYSTQPASLLPDMHQLMLSPMRPSDSTNKPTAPTPVPVTGLPPPGLSASSQARAMRAAQQSGGGTTSPRQSAATVPTGQQPAVSAAGFTSQAEQLLARLRNVKWSLLMSRALYLLVHSFIAGLTVFIGLLMFNFISSQAV